MDNILIMILLIIYMLIMAYLIGDAVKRFKRKNYFIFGLNTIIVIYEIIVLAYLVFEGKII